MDREGLRVVPEAAPDVEGESAAPAEHGARTETAPSDQARAAGRRALLIGTQMAYGVLAGLLWAVAVAAESFPGTLRMTRSCLCKPIEARRIRVALEANR